MFYKSMLHKHLTVPCAHTSIFLYPHMQSHTVHMLSFSYFILLFWFSSLLVISYQLYYLTAVFVFPYFLEHIQSTSVLQAQICALCNTELFDMITDCFSGSFLALTCALESQLAQKRQEVSAFMPSLEILSRVHFKTKQNNKLFKNFDFIASLIFLDCFFNSTVVWQKVKAILLLISLGLLLMCAEKAVWEH